MRRLVSRAERRGAGLSAAVVLMLSVGMLSFAVSAVIILESPNYSPRVDSADYANIAQAIAHGEGIGRVYPSANGRRALVVPESFRAPLYPIVLSPAFVVGGLRLARLVTAVLGAVAVMLLFAVVRELWGTRAALLAGLFAAVYPPLVISTVGLFTEPLFLALELVVLFGLLRFQHRRRGLPWPVAIGVAAGLASMTRPDGLLLIPLSIMGVWLGAADRRAALRTAGVTLVAAALAMAPWTIRNAVVFGHFIPSTTEPGYSLIAVLNDHARAIGGDSDVSVWPAEIARAGGISERQEAQPAVYARLDSATIGDRLTSRALRYAVAHPGYAVSAVARNVLRSLDLANGRQTGFKAYGQLGTPESQIWDSLVPATYLIYALALIGGLVLLRDRSLRRPPLIFYLVPTLLLLTSGLAGGAMRYRLPFDPLLLSFAGLALAVCARRRVAGARSALARHRFT